MPGEKLTWKDVVAEALRELGGEGHLSQINEQVEGHPKTATNPTWRATIRRVVRQYKVFQAVPGEGAGVYRLTEAATPQPKHQRLDLPHAEINHGIAQGMLVTVGSIYGYETFVPAHDQTASDFQGKKLGDWVTVSNCNQIFHGPNLPKIRQIDTLWFDEDDHGLFPVYAFEVEHTTRVKNGLDRLLKIPSRFAVQFFVIAPGEEERSLFERLVSQTPFRRYREKFTFRAYSDLERLYNSAIRHDAERASFGLTERHRKI